MSSKNIFTVIVDTLGNDESPIGTAPSITEAISLACSFSYADGSMAKIYDHQRKIGYVYYVHEGEDRLGDPEPKSGFHVNIFLEYSDSRRLLGEDA
jgi:hypothetical protein